MEEPNQKEFVSYKFTIDMRKVFKSFKKLFWFPAHQGKALRALEKGIHQIDYVIEVRDSRIPISSENPLLREILRRKRVLIMNKSDLCDLNSIKAIKDKFKQGGEQVVYACLKSEKKKGLQEILDVLKEKILQDPTRFPYLQVVIVGLPNVGKSSLVNNLRNFSLSKEKVMAVGPQAGVTQRIQTRVLISEDPKVYVVDTPGIFDPYVSTPLQGLKIALTGGSKDSLYDKVHVADYLLFRLNNSKKKWFKIINVEESDSILDVLSEIATNLKFYKQKIGKNKKIIQEETIEWDGYEVALNLIENKFPVKESEKELDLDKAAEWMIEMFRKGKFGRMTLDDVSNSGLERFFNGESDQESGTEERAED
jgi:ribosome biogenesis GTPase A